MLAGHYGPAYALKAARPDLPLGALCLAAQLPDLLWAAFALAGPERASVDPHPPAGTPAVRLAAAPYSHSLLAVLGWAAAAGAGVPPGRSPAPSCRTGCWTPSRRRPCPCCRWGRAGGRWASAWSGLRGRPSPPTRSCCSGAWAGTCARRRPTGARPGRSE